MWPFRPPRLSVLVIAALIAPLVHPSSAAAAAVGDRFYEEIELLEVKGLVTSALLSTRPFGPREEERVAAEAAGGLGRLRSSGADAAAVGAMVERLRPVDDGARAAVRAGASARFLYSGVSPRFQSVNNNGDSFREGPSERAAVQVDASAGGALSLGLTPYYKGDAATSSAYLLRGYAAVDYKGVHLLAGRDSMWWGSSFHGALLVSNNAKPFDMVKLSSTHPFTLPSFLSYLGAFRPTVFLTRLESERDFPRANLLGMRLDFRPAPAFQFGLSRVFMFGGKGRSHLDAGDWLSILFASDSAEHSGSPIDGNQIVSVDASFVHVNGSSYLPYSGLKAYMELGAEDSSGKTKTPTGRASIYGLFVDGPLWLKGVDLRVEWADTAHNMRYGPSWYTHAVYTSGYTYEGKVIGHHMGGDSRDLFVRARWRVTRDFTAGAEVDKETKGVHGQRAENSWAGMDAEWRLEGGASIRAGAGVEKVDGARSNVLTTALETRF